MSNPFTFLKNDQTKDLPCSICGNQITDRWGGNSSWPLTDDPTDKCCDECNIRYVIPDRLRHQRLMDEEKD